MGQMASADASPQEENNTVNGVEESDKSAGTTSSMEALLAEATATGNNNENESLEVMAQKALECPCVAELRDGPCGETFSESFKCFIKSTSEEKGSDCVQPFIALQKCIEANPDAFAKYNLDDDDSTDGRNAQEKEGSLPSQEDGAAKGEEAKITRSKAIRDH